MNQLHAYTDADWAGCPYDRRSTGRYTIYLGTNLISWAVKKQHTVARSSTEAKYRAIGDTAVEVVWLRFLLFEVGLQHLGPTVLWCDNIGATYLTTNPVFHARMKHVEIDYHFVREMVRHNHLHVRFLSLKDQIADAFTKPLPLDRF